MYAFNTNDGQTYRTSFSGSGQPPREVANLWCFDAWDNAGNSYIILSENTDFKTFEYED